MTPLDEPLAPRSAGPQRRVRTRSVEGTHAVAAALAGWVRPGDVVVLSGDLGAGKTTFTQGLAHELGVTEPVTSPTFAILQHYRGMQRSQHGEAGLLLNHLDVYRLGSLDEAEALGLDELLDGEGVTLIEWGEGIESLLGSSLLTITLQLAPLGEDRRADGDDGDPLDERLVRFELLGFERPRQQEFDRALISALESDDVELDDGRPC